jgi:hypothetical protein
MAQAQAVRSNHADTVGEVVTEATIIALNSALADRGIEAEQIISILPIEPQTLVTIAPAKFRVLYRKTA